jgi:hypothetical protein
MSKASDLIGKSGAGGQAPVSAPKVKAQPNVADDHKNPAHQGPNPVRGGQSPGGTGKAPIGRRPKV